MKPIIYTFIFAFLFGLSPSTGKYWPEMIAILAGIIVSVIVNHS